VKILNKLRKSNGMRVGLCVAACMLGVREAHAEVVLSEQDGWTFTFDGRVNSFLSAGFGDDLPAPTPNPDPMAPVHTVMGENSAAGNGVPNVGWPANYGQSDPSKQFTSIRVRSGMYGNILGFGIARKLSEDTIIRGYISIWSTVESLSMDKWAPVPAEAREGYLTAIGPWGSVKIGRMLTWMGRSGYEIDTLYGHGYGVGLPCTDALGPACGHIGTGALHPGYGAGFQYSTPSLGGLQLHVGIYDPIVFGEGSWTLAPFVRPEGSLAFDRRLGASSRIKVSVEGVYQPLSRVETDMATMTDIKFNTALWGVSGGLRLDVGPVRLGLSGFHGKGISLYYALQRTQATEDRTHELRLFTGAYGQAALVFGRLQLSGGFGLAQVQQTPDDKQNIRLSVIHYQAGYSGGVYFYATDNIVLGLDFFQFVAKWYGAPTGTEDTAVVPPTVVITGKLAGEQQIVRFVNAGVTYHW